MSVAPEVALVERILQRPSRDYRTWRVRDVLLAKISGERGHEVIELKTPIEYANIEFIDPAFKIPERYQFADRIELHLVVTLRDHAAFCFARATDYDGTAMGDIEIMGRTPIQSLEWLERALRGVLDPILAHDPPVQVLRAIAVRPPITVHAVQSAVFEGLRDIQDSYLQFLQEQFRTVKRRLQAANYSVQDIRALQDYAFKCIDTVVLLEDSRPCTAATEVEDLSAAFRSMGGEKRRRM